MVSTGCPIAFIPLLVGSALLHTSRLCELPQTVPRRARCRAVRTHGSGLLKYFRRGQFAARCWSSASEAARSRCEGRL